MQRFASVGEKRQWKNYSRMGLFQAGEFILERKCLGILALPLITLKGTTRSANGPLGNALEHFCGYNYQHYTLDKFLRELKSLGEPIRCCEVRWLFSRRTGASTRRVHPDCLSCVTTWMGIRSRSAPTRGSSKRR